MTTQALHLGSAAAIVTLCSLSSVANAQTDWRKQHAVIDSRGAQTVSLTNRLPDYPRPQMVRSQWKNLNGLWSYAITAALVPPSAGADFDPRSFTVKFVSDPSAENALLSHFLRSAEPELPHATCDRSPGSARTVTDERSLARSDQRCVRTLCFKKGRIGCQKPLSKQ